MKTLAAILFALLVPAAAFSANRSVTVTADGALLTVPRVLCAVYVMTDGTNPVTVALYENSAASGKRPLGPFTTPAAERLYGTLLPAIAVDKLYLDITTVGTAYVTIVHGKDTCE